MHFFLKVNANTLTSLIVEQDIPNIFVQVQVLGRNYFTLKMCKVYL